MARNGQNLITLRDIKKLRVAHTTSESSKIKSLSYHHNGEHIIYNTDDKIVILKCNDKVEEFSISVKKYGAGLCKFFDINHIVHTSTKVDNDLRLMKNESREYVRYFEGHTEEVVSVDVAETLIVSGSKDKSVRLWDPRKQLDVRKETFKSTPLVAFKPNEEGIIAVAYDSSTIEIYSCKNFKETLKKFELGTVADVEWTGIKFSPCGTILMVTTNSTSIVILDADTGQEMNNFRDYRNPENDPIDACFVPKTNFVLGGSIEGFVHVWDMKTSFKEHSLRSGHEGSCNLVAFNPKFVSIATTSANTNAHIWIEKD